MWRRCHGDVLAPISTMLAAFVYGIAGRMLALPSNLVMNVVTIE
jgi:hypothetical protein